jgi:Flp pilus assembly protein TadG
MPMLCAGFIKCTRGTTTVEFAFVAPAMFLLMTGTLFLGMLVYTAMGMQTAVEKAARCYSVDARQCSSAASAQTYAQTNYFGVSSPTFTASTQQCGCQVSAALRFNMGWSIPLAAKACFPLWKDNLRTVCDR